jgi:hypothetical protein
MEDSAAAAASPFDADPDSSNSNSGGLLGPALLKALEGTSNNIISPKDAIALLLFALPLRGDGGRGGSGPPSSFLPFHLRTALRDAVCVCLCLFFWVGWNFRKRFWRGGGHCGLYRDFWGGCFGNVCAE